MTTRHTLSEVARIFTNELHDLYSGNEIRNIGYLVSEYLLNYSKIDFHMKDQEPISAEITQKFMDVLDRLKNREPVQYITGSTEFYGLPFRVDKRVLIPRPETEELVDWIIHENMNISGLILDLGTGSGCIAIALALKLPGAKVSACDISQDALALAIENVQVNHASVRFFEMDLLDNGIGLPDHYEVIVSNPPYVLKQDKALMRRNVLDHEPEIALFVPDNDPLLYYRHIALLGRKYLRDGGKLYLEINENLPGEIKRLLENTGYYGIEVRKDLNGKARMVRGYK